jgi:hypothetical protein
MPTLHSKRWMTPVAMAAVCLLLAAAIPIVMVSRILLTLVVVLLAMAVMEVLKQVPARARDPYDLSELRRIHEEEEMQEAMEYDVAGDASEAVCPHCGNVYTATYPLCPECGRRG